MLSEIFISSAKIIYLASRRTRTCPNELLLSRDWEVKESSMTLFSCSAWVGYHGQSTATNEVLANPSVLCLFADRAQFGSSIMEKNSFNSFAGVTNFFFLPYGFALTLQLISAVLMQMCSLIIWTTSNPLLSLSPFPPPQCTCFKNNCPNRRYFWEFHLK